MASAAFLERMRLTLLACFANETLQMELEHDWRFHQAQAVYAARGRVLWHVIRVNAAGDGLEYAYLSHVRRKLTRG